MKVPDPLFVTYWLGHVNHHIMIEQLPEGIDVINLFPINLDAECSLQNLYITGSGLTWAAILKEVRAKQRKGTKVMASIMSTSGDGFTWNTITDPARFAEDVYELVVNQWELDGIDIIPEMSGEVPNDNFIKVIKYLSKYFGPRSKTGMSMSYAASEYYSDEQLLKQCNALFDHVSLMGHSWDKETVINQFELYAGLVSSKKLLPGVQPGNTQLTTLTEVVELSRWQPHNGLKGGMMLFNINSDKDFDYTKTLVSALKTKEFIS